MTWIAMALVALASAQGAELLVAAASDLAPLSAELAKVFEQSGGVKVRFTLASSGSLMRQIQEGAPYDVFLSANDQYVAQLAASGRIDRASVTIYAQGRLGLWSPDGGVRVLTDLKKPEIQHLAIPNPEHAPYGVAARKMLENRGLWKDVQPKIVYGENVRQALRSEEH